MILSLTGQDRWHRTADRNGAEQQRELRSCYRGGTVM